MSLLPASITSAIPSRAKIFNVPRRSRSPSPAARCSCLDLPGGLISGAMIAVGIAAIAGRPLHMPPILAQSVLVLLGISLGSLISQQILHNIGALHSPSRCWRWQRSVHLRQQFYLQRVHGWDQTSALLAGSPGALSQITILAAEKGADVAGIAVVQTMRVIFLTAALPVLLALTGIAPSSPPAAAAAIATPLELAELIAASVAAALLLRLISFRRAGCSAP